MFNRRQIISYLMVGGIATVIDWTIYYILTKVGIDPLAGNVAAFLVSVIYNFWASRKYVFSFSPDDTLAKQFAKFMTTALSGLAISEAIIYVGVRKLQLNELLVKIMATGVTMVINFIVRKLWMERSEET